MNFESEYSRRSDWVVIRAFNEASTIAEVAARALSQVGNVVVVDDGSTDGTAERTRGMAVHLLQNPANRGKSMSLIAGLNYAMDHGARRVITLDGDGQHRPEDIGAIVACAERHPCAIIIGSRLAAPTDMPRARYRANLFANFLISWACGYWVEDTRTWIWLLREAFFVHWYWVGRAWARATRNRHMLDRIG
ncbi:MAG: glycosyltransferase family 2 protein [Alphaproteobacteria bacterium]|nr:glycosyltransferase family 2 protein [Alphaproteobacteria bacterium]